MNRSARRIELPEFKSLNDDELYYLHRLRKYGSGEFKNKRIGIFNLDRGTVKIIGKRGVRFREARYICWGCDLVFLQGFAYLSSVGTVYFCYSCKELARPTKAIDTMRLALQGGRAGAI